MSREAETQTTPLDRALPTGDLDIFKAIQDNCMVHLMDCLGIICSQGTDLNTITKPLGGESTMSDSLLLFSLKNHANPDIIELLIKNGADPDKVCVDITGIALNTGNFKVVKLITDNSLKGFDPSYMEDALRGDFTFDQVEYMFNHINTPGFHLSHTTLHASINKDDVRFVKLVLKHYTHDLDVPTCQAAMDKGYQFLEEVLKYHNNYQSHMHVQNDIYNHLIRNAADQNNQKSLSIVLKYADKSKVSEGALEDALKVAVVNENTAMVQALTKFGAVCTDEILLEGLGHGRVIIKALLESNADPNASKDGSSALHKASTKGDFFAAKMLLEANASAASADADGKTPLELAMGNYALHHLLDSIINPHAEDAASEAGSAVLVGLGQTDSPEIASE